jgi:hypothetical protein
MKIKLPKSIQTIIARYEKAVGRPDKERGPSRFGWSSVSVYQVCPYLYQRRQETKKIDSRPGAFYLEVGDLVHWLMELRYETGQVVPVDTMRIALGLTELGGDPAVVAEGTRVFDGYASHYGDEAYLYPLLVEKEIEAASIAKTYRLDLLARIVGHPQYADGLYFVDHKTASAITAQLVKQWDNDGQVLTGHHAALYGDLLVEFPELADQYRGIIINIIGKQKIKQKFERIFCLPDAEKLQRFAEELQYWDALISMSKATGVYTRQRVSCSGKYSLCSLFSEC